MKNKIKIMKTKPDVTDEEIRAMMDFDRLMAHYKAAPVSRIGIRSYVIIATTGILISVAGWYFLNRTDNTQKLRDVQPAATPELRASGSIDSSGTEPRKEDPASIQKMPEANPKQKEPAAANAEASKAPVNQNLDSSQATSSGLQTVFVQAEPIEGYENLYAYFKRELRYPQSEVKDSVQGEVTVVFTINTVGKPENIEIENSLGLPFDREAVRLIENMPAWKAATYNSKPVASRISLPLTFQVKKIRR